jgi:hypothetical protein
MVTPARLVIVRRQFRGGYYPNPQGIYVSCVVLVCLAQYARRHEAANRHRFEKLKSSGD